MATAKPKADESKADAKPAAKPAPKRNLTRESIKSKVGADRAKSMIPE